MLPQSLTSTLTWRSMFESYSRFFSLLKCVVMQDSTNVASVNARLNNVCPTCRLKWHFILCSLCGESRRKVVWTTWKIPALLSNGHLLVHIFFEYISSRKYALCTSPLGLVWLFYRIESPGCICCQLSWSTYCLTWRFVVHPGSNAFWTMYGKLPPVAISPPPPDLHLFLWICQHKQIRVVHVTIKFRMTVLWSRTSWMHWVFKICFLSPISYTLGFPGLFFCSYIEANAQVIFLEFLFKLNLNRNFDIWLSNPPPHKYNLDQSHQQV